MILGGATLARSGRQRVTPKRIDADSRTEIGELVTAGIRDAALKLVCDERPGLRARQHFNCPLGWRFKSSGENPVATLHIAATENTGKR